MKELTKKAFTGLIWLQIIMAVMLFAPAWTLHFCEAWTFWLLFSVLSAVVTFYFLKHDPGLVESRLKVGPTAEHEKSQKIIQTLQTVALLFERLGVRGRFKRQPHIKLCAIRTRAEVDFSVVTFDNDPVADNQSKSRAGAALGCEEGHRKDVGPGL